jgi:predicted RNA polymerase sigma factor
MPPAQERDERLRAVLHVLYLVFNEGYTATSGSALQRGDLSAEALRLTRLLHRLLPEEGEVAGLLALMLLTDARRLARSGPDGELIPLAEQDRGLWDAGAIAAVHAQSPSAEDTDWPQILALYLVLEGVTDNPMVTLNRAVAVAMVDGPDAGLALLDGLDGDTRIAEHHRLHAVRGHVLEMAGDEDTAVTCYRAAAKTRRACRSSGTSSCARPS